MRHHDSDPHDALNDYLDSLAGAPPTDSRAGDLESDLRDGVDRFFDLAERAGMAPEQPRRPTMNATLPASTTLAPTRKPRRSVTLPAWTQHLHFVSTGLLLVAVVALTFAAFGPNGIRNGESDGNGDGPDLNGAVPIATVPEDAETSSIPFPTAEECTVDPLTEQQVIDLALQGASGPGNAVSKIDSTSVPTDPQTTEIMSTFREFQACAMKGPHYKLAMMTPFGIAQELMILYLPGDGTPVTEASVAERVDAWIVDPSEPTRTPAPTAASDESFPLTPVPEGVDEMGTPVAAGATMVPEAGMDQLDVVLTLFPDDIQMIDDSNAIAVAYWVDLHTMEVQYADPRVLRLTMVDGQWPVDGQRDGLGQG